LKHTTTSERSSTGASLTDKEKLGNEILSFESSEEPPPQAVSIIVDRVQAKKCFLFNIIFPIELKYKDCFSVFYSLEKSNKIKVNLVISRLFLRKNDTLFLASRLLLGNLSIVLGAAEI